MATGSLLIEITLIFLAISKVLKSEQEYIPSIFRNNLSQSPLLYRAGMYCKEIGTPINKTVVSKQL